MAKKLSITILLALCLWGVSGSVAFAADSNSTGLVQCGRETDAKKAATSCDFIAAISMINRLIKYLIMIATVLAAIVFAYAGWLRLTAGDNSGQITKSNNAFKFVGIGFLVILSGWLVFTLIAKTFLDPGADYGTYLTK